MSKDDEQIDENTTAAETPDVDAELTPSETADGEAVASDAVDSGEPECHIEPTRVVEAVLMAADAPITAQKIANIMGTGTGRDVKAHIEALNEQYESWDVSFRIEQLAGGYQILTQPQFNTWLKKLLRVRAETKLTGAAMETLSIVAYKQPCTRADVEAVRGVAVGEVMNRLRDMNMVKIVGRAEDLGRPILYGTTRRFLEVFGLGSIDDLPQVEALKPGGKAVAKSDAAKESKKSDSASDDTDDEAGADAVTGSDEPGDEIAPGGDERESPSLALVHDEAGTDGADPDEGMARRAVND